MFVKPEMIEKESMRLIEEGMDKKRIAFYSKRELKL